MTTMYFPMASSILMDYELAKQNLADAQCRAGLYAHPQITKRLLTLYFGTKLSAGIEFAADAQIVEATNYLIGLANILTSTIALAA